MLMNTRALITITLLSSLSFLTLASEVKTMSQTQLLSLLNAPKTEHFVVLDVRSAEEFQQGHIKGAINIAHDKIEQHLTKLAGFENKMIVVHCRSGRRAKTAEAVLLDNGYSKLRHLQGDYKGWVAANLPLVK